MRRNTKRLIGLPLITLVLSGPAWAQEDLLGAALAAQAETDQAAVASQERIDEIHDETQALVTRYRQALADTDSMKRYNEQLAVQVASQSKTVADMRTQLAEIENTHREVLPLMEKMVTILEQFVALDVPFLVEERTKRVTGLKDLMARADVTNSEKYRRILEAYQIELDYGRTLEAYEGTLGEGAAKKTVQFVRLGRVTLLYQTLDGKETGYWDAPGKAWVKDDSYAHDVKEALRVAKKQGAPDLLMLPIPAPKEVKS
jgi:DNA-binding Lrp family transcriptional regulator